MATETGKSRVYRLDAAREATDALIVGQARIEQGDFGSRAALAGFATEPFEGEEGVGYAGRLEGRLEGASRFGPICTFNQDDAWNVVLFDTVPGLVVRVVRLTGQFVVRFSG